MNGSDHRGPSDDFLRKLAQVLPGMAEAAVKDGTKKGKLALANKLEPQQECQVCRTLFDFKPKSKIIGAETVNHPKQGVCEDCTERLQRGEIAFVSPGRTLGNGKGTARFSFVDDKENRLPQMHGKIVPINDDTMDAIQKKYAERKNATN